MEFKSKFKSSEFKIENSAKKLGVTKSNYNKILNELKFRTPNTDSYYYTPNNNFYVSLYLLFNNYSELSSIAIEEFHMTHCLNTEEYQELESIYAFDEDNIMEMKSITISKIISMNNSNGLGINGNFKRFMKIITWRWYYNNYKKNVDKLNFSLSKLDRNWMSFLDVKFGNDGKNLSSFNKKFKEAGEKANDVVKILFYYRLWFQYKKHEKFVKYFEEMYECMSNNRKGLTYDCILEYSRYFLYNQFMISQKDKKMIDYDSTDNYCRDQFFYNHCNASLMFVDETLNRKFTVLETDGLSCLNEKYVQDIPEIKYYYFRNRTQKAKESFLKFHAQLYKDFVKTVENSSIIDINFSLGLCDYPNIKLQMSEQIASHPQCKFHNTKRKFKKCQLDKTIHSEWDYQCEFTYYNYCLTIADHDQLHSKLLKQTYDLLEDIEYKHNKIYKLDQNAKYKEMNSQIIGFIEWYEIKINETFSYIINRHISQMEFNHEENKLKLLYDSYSKSLLTEVKEIKLTQVILNLLGSLLPDDRVRKLYLIKFIFIQVFEIIILRRNAFMVIKGLFYYKLYNNPNISEIDNYSDEEYPFKQKLKLYLSSYNSLKEYSSNIITRLIIFYSQICYLYQSLFDLLFWIKNDYFSHDRKVEQWTWLDKDRNYCDRNYHDGDLTPYGAKFEYKYIQYRDQAYLKYPILQKFLSKSTDYFESEYIMQESQSTNILYISSILNSIKVWISSHYGSIMFWVIYIEHWMNYVINLSLSVTNIIIRHNLEEAIADNQIIIQNSFHELDGLKDYFTDIILDTVILNNYKFFALTKHNISKIKSNALIQSRVLVFILYIFLGFDKFKSYIVDICLGLLVYTFELRIFNYLYTMFANNELFISYFTFWDKMDCSNLCYRAYVFLNWRSLLSQTEIEEYKEFMKLSKDVIKDNDYLYIGKKDANTNSRYAQNSGSINLDDTDSESLLYHKMVLTSKRFFQKLKIKYDISSFVKDLEYTNDIILSKIKN